MIDVFVTIATFALGIGMLLATIPGTIPLLIISIRRHKMRRRVRNQDATIITQYEAPQGLSPAEIAYLYNNQITADDVRATVLDIKERRLFDASEALLITKHSKSLLPHEKIAIKIASQGQIGAEDSTNRDHTMNEFRFAVRSKLVERRLLHRRLVYPILINLAVLLFSPYVISYITSLADFSPIYASVFRNHFLILNLSYIILAMFGLAAVFSIAAFVTATRNSVYTLSTAKLRTLWPAIEGFRRFLAETEQERVLDEIENNVSVSSDFYAYCIAFRLTPPPKQSVSEQ